MAHEWRTVHGRRILVAICPPRDAAAGASRQHSGRKRNKSRPRATTNTKHKRSKRNRYPAELPDREIRWYPSERMARAAQKCAWAARSAIDAECGIDRNVPALTRSEMKAYRLCRRKGWTVHRNGWPDFICETPEGLCFVEVKSPNDTVPPHQRRVHELLRAAGFRVLVLWVSPRKGVRFKDEGQGRVSCAVARQVETPAQRHGQAGQEAATDGCSDGHEPIPSPEGADPRPSIH